MKLLIILFLSCSSLLAAEPERSRFAADRYIRKMKEHKVVLEGNVKVIKGDSLLTADTVELDTETDEFTARGTVVFKGSNFEMHGDEMSSNMGSAHGVLKKGYVTSKVDRIDGKDIERLSRKKFKIKEGRFTSCKNSPPDWRFYGNRIDLTVGEYSYMNNVIIEGFGLPVAYIPYMVLPIKSERQTGLLPPHFSFGADGFGIHESLFVTLGRSQDTTLTLGNYNNRGFKQGFEYRYAASERSNGTFYYFHINDRKFANLILSNGQPTNHYTRQSLKFDNTTAIGKDTYARARIRYASDANIPRDFIEEIDGRADAALESKLMVMSKSNNAAYTGEAAFYQDMLSTNPLNFNKNQLHRFPELRVNIAKVRYSNIMIEGDASYLHVYRPANFFDDKNNDGTYNSGDFIRTGQRFDFYPRASMPITTKYLKITPQAALRYDYYMLPADGSAQKSYPELKTDFSSEITRIYKRAPGTEFRSIKHVIEPFVTHRVIPNVWKTHHPFFDTNTNGVQSPMFDSIDSVGKTHAITYGVTNRLLAKHIKDPIPYFEKDEDEEIEPEKETEEQKDAVEMQKKDAQIKMGSNTNVDELCTANDELLEWIKKREDEHVFSNKTNPASIVSMMTTSRSDICTSKKPAYLEDNKDVEEFTVIQPLQWKVYQSYNFIDTTGRPFSYLYSDLSGGYSWASVIISNFYNFYTHKMGVNSFLTFTSATGAYLRIGYSYNKTEQNIAVNQARFGFGFKFWRFLTNARFIYNNEATGSLGQKIQDRYFDVAYFPPSACWFFKVSASIPYDKPGFNFTFTFNMIISGEAVGFAPGAGGSMFGRL